MRAYIIRRILLIIPTIILASMIVFAVVRFIPGDIIDQMVADMVKVTELDRQALERALGLDASVPVQYLRWMGIIPHPEEGYGGILQGDFGDSLWKSTPVTREITNRLPVTFELGLIALLISQLIALPVGISFYTFQSMSYSLDIYQGKMKQWRSFWDFALYVTFFPQLVAGPIVRAKDFLPQLIDFLLGQIKSDDRVYYKGFSRRS